MVFAGRNEAAGYRLASLSSENVRKFQESEALFLSDEPVGLEAVLNVIRSILRWHAAAT